MGDGRTYDYTLALRAVTTSDFMTADWARIPYDVLDKISTRIVNEVKGINRICYDITSKPPATIESVSYTHLDVYKRQAPPWPALSPPLTTVC